MLLHLPRGLFSGVPCHSAVVYSGCLKLADLMCLVLNVFFVAKITAGLISLTLTPYVLHIC